MVTFRVIVRSYEDENYLHVIGTGLSESRADRVDSGVNINLDHENYYTCIEEEAS